MLMQKQIAWVIVIRELMFIGHSFIYSLDLFSFVNQKNLKYLCQLNVADLLLLGFLQKLYKATEIDQSSPQIFSSQLIHMI